MINVNFSSYQCFFWGFIIIEWRGHQSSTMISLKCLSITLLAFVPANSFDAIGNMTKMKSENRYA